MILYLVLLNAFYYLLGQSLIVIISSASLSNLPLEIISNATYSVHSKASLYVRTKVKASVNCLCEIIFLRLYNY